MSRYRPPQPPGSPYITETGRKKLADELDFLWRKRRPEVTRALSEAAAEGDRSENAEYIYRKKELREIDRRVRYLSRRLDVLKVVDRAPDDTSKVFFGAWVELEDESGESRRYRIVGADEFDQQDEYISMDAPVARSLLGKSLDDEVEVHSPKGIIRYIITDIQYQR